MPNELAAGLYDLLLTDRELARVSEAHGHTRPLTHGEVDRLIEVLHRQLSSALDDLAEADSMQPQLRLINELIAEMRRRLPSTEGDVADLISNPPQILTSVRRQGVHPTAPDTGLSLPWLFTAGKGSPSLLGELRRELAASEQVDILVSFITVSGVRKLRDVFESATAVGADGNPPLRIRILTTTYIGATEADAVRELAKLPGCRVRISLDGRRTRLHAKAWIFHRDTGFGTAYVGSANLSGAAMAGGLEWTVKFTQRMHADMHARAVAHFDTLWEDPEFQAYDPENEEHHGALVRALRQEGRDTTVTPLISFFELQPKTYQLDMLEQLANERLHNRNRNLVVAATGTGKTVIAAFDYRRTCQAAGHKPRLLFVAHRREILEQALRTYREVLRDGSFGQLLTGIHAPTGYEHLFATIDSFSSGRLLESLGVDYWHTVVFDECHRLAGDRFRAIVSSIQPRILLGLTATPERTDGQPIAPFFDARPDGSPAVELRLWDALDLQLLVPFEYYACNDETNFSAVPWNRVGEQQAIAELISNNDVRARTVLREWQRLTPNPRNNRALVFCVSVEHAEFMASFFQDRGLPVAAVHGGSSASERALALDDLAAGRLCALVTVDLFNEGVDLPSVDTLLMLRPTQSALLFQQQLGRGLRLSHGKEACLVLDFVGHHNADFRFDRLLSPITGQSKRELIQSVEHGFSSLPAGCHIHLQKQVRDRILHALRQQISNQWRGLRAELQALAALGKQPTLGEFLREQAIDLDSVYRDNGPRGWTTLKRAAGLLVAEPGPEEAYLSERISNLRHRDAPNQIEALRWAAQLAEGEVRELSPDESLLVQSLAYQLDGTRDRLGGPEEFLNRLRANPFASLELRELADVLESRSVLSSIPLPGIEDSLLTLHGSYELREILTAVKFHDATKRPLFNTGVLRLPKRDLELMFVTLDKSTGYHAGISYHDYAMSPSLFHWQSQNSAGPDTPAGRRYLDSATNGWTFQLLVRTDKNHPYVACGPVRFVESRGQKPMNIVWELVQPLTAKLFEQFSVLRQK